MLGSNGKPDVCDVYHKIFVPFATKFETVGKLAAQKTCIVLPVGGGTINICTLITFLVVSQPVIGFVWLA